MPRKRRIGIDLGGTKISAIVLDDADTVLEHRRIATPQDDYEAVIALINQLVNELEHEHGSASVGIGMPRKSAISRTNRSGARIAFS